MGDLAVDLYGAPLGVLRGDWRSFDLHVAGEALERFGLGSRILSEAVPLVLSGHPRGAGARRNFFAELLPEGPALTTLAAAARMRELDAVGLLRRFGRDVAGAVQVWDVDEPGEPRTPRAVAVSAAGIDEALRRLGAAPLGNSTAGGKTSLPGVQPKLVLALIGDRWHFVEDGYPSTHIVKPADGETTIFDEEFGSRLARRAGLVDYQTALTTFGTTETLVIERYDRAPDAPGGRVHQEDMCQALGVGRAAKYQEHGGRISLRRIADLVRRRLEPDALVTLARRITFAVAVGDLDVHGKNLSIVRPLDEPPRLAPAYDNVPMRHRANDQRLALAVNGVYRHADVTLADLVTEFELWGLRDEGRAAVTETLDAVRATAAGESPARGAHPGLADDIAGFAANLLAGRPAG